MPIQQLPDHVVAQIAAGEVVERPASVIKELVENALDAGATTIQVTSNGGGQKLLRVSDDGSGIRNAEVELAFARHATSKLRTADDLLSLQTLGFRGEALCSIAAVAQVTCVTRHRDEQTGLSLRLEGSQVVARRAVGAPAGTVITVENLFYNVPVRLKFLKKDTTEKRQIGQIVTLYAIAYPHVRFVLVQDDREVFRSSGSGRLEDVMVSAFGVEVFKQMLPIDTTTDRIRVVGHTSRPEAARPTRERIHAFINGRAIQDPMLVRAITDAYQGWLPDKHYPVSVLLVEVPAEEVDVNVHPTKAEVRFRDPGAVYTAVQRAVREAVLGTGHTPPPNERAGLPADPVRAARRARTDAPLFEPSATPAPPEPDAQPDDDPDDERAFDVSHIPEGLGQPDRPRTLPVLRVIGQAGQRHILAEGPSSLFIIDQHAAHQRVLYDSARRALLRGDTPPQTEDIAGTAKLPPAHSRQLEPLLPVLARLGLVIEAFGPNLYRVAVAPRFLAGLDAETVVQAVMRALLTTPSLSDDSLLAALCKVGAVSAGMGLTLPDQQTLIRELERATDPLTAPDGAPVFIEFSADQLAREFKRR
jgi:DNA mismatch repair protein MutL